MAVSSLFHYYGQRVTTINIETGEITSRSIPSLGRKLPSPSATKRIGVSVPFPYFCRSREDLIECLSILDPYWKINSKAQVKDWLLLQALIEGYLQQSEVSAILALSNSITGWNIIYGNKVELRPESISRPTWFRAIKSLEEKKIIYLLSDKHQQEIWLIHPFYCWKGDIIRIPSYIDQWHHFSQSIIPSPVQQ